MQQSEYMKLLVALFRLFYSTQACGVHLCTSTTVLLYNCTSTTVVKQDFTMRKLSKRSPCKNAATEQVQEKMNYLKYKISVLQNNSINTKRNVSVGNK